MIMQVTPTSLGGVVEIVPSVYPDSRGCFFESYHINRYRDVGIERPFVQDNISYSIKDTLRGLHLQHPNDQGKLVQVIRGEILDVAVDVRRGSATFGKWVAATLSEDNKKQLYIPEGFAHGFCVTSDEAYVLYKCTEFYSPEDELGILWSDPFIAISWPTRMPLLSPKDSQSLPLKEIDPIKLPSI